MRDLRKKERGTEKRGERKYKRVCSELVRNTERVIGIHPTIVTVHPILEALTIKHQKYALAHLLLPTDVTDSRT